MKTTFLLLICLMLFQCKSLTLRNGSANETIIKSNQYKVDVVQKDSEKFATVYYTLFINLNSKWEKIQKGSFRKETGFPLIVDSEDLNNDGFLDVKISFMQAGNGSNSIQKLLIFDPTKEILIDVKNSPDYSNLQYNSTRDCITSLGISGGTSTTFLHLKDDLLQEFGRVDYRDDTVKSYRIKDKVETLLQTIPFKTEDANVSFSNFDPIEE